MQVIMISIRPKWCELIVSGKKTIEVRKTRPKIETPFKCYIYCTKPSRKHRTICGCMVLNDDELYRHPTQGIKHGDSVELMLRDDYTKDNFLNGKVIGEFVCDKIDRMAYCGASNDDIQLKLVDVGLRAAHISGEYLSQCQLSYMDMTKYANGRDIYGWHISDLVIYDRPRPLSGFRTSCTLEADCGLCPYYDHSGQDCAGRRITRPPQSWCYVEALP